MSFQRAGLAAFAFLIVGAAFARNPRHAFPLLGFQDAAAELHWEHIFLEAPNRQRAEEHMKVLAAEPHPAGSPEDRKTADYVAHKFREAGLETSIVEYRVWMNYPAEVSVDVTAPAAVHMHGPTPEEVDGNYVRDRTRILPAFNAYSASGDVDADVVYANYGRPEDIDKLREMGIDCRGKIVVMRYGEIFRGAKVWLAQENGAAGVILYSDPIDDGYFKGDVYPNGPWRPSQGVQRGTVEFGFEYPGDPTTPGFASLPSLPDSKRVPPASNPDVPHIPVTPLSAHDIQPILANLDGQASPRGWQGALPFTYHIGPGPVRVKLHVKENSGYHTIWNVIGTIRGTQYPGETVIAGNHRDAWVYGAVDPVSGTVAMLEAVHGFGDLLKAGWHPRRTIIFASWDAEEQGLIGSTEWAEEHATDLQNAVAYFNTDVGAFGPNFRASATPSLKRFLCDITRAVPSPKGGSLYENWSGSNHVTSPANGSGYDVALGTAVQISRNRGGVVTKSAAFSDPGLRFAVEVGVSAVQVS
ncbi:MAG TPA: M28 family peptidase [Terriglobales bacterium]|nr:M28 family peptidase [Terriglobales bacterium]